MGQSSTWKDRNMSEPQGKGPWGSHSLSSIIPTRPPAFAGGLLHAGRPARIWVNRTEQNQQGPCPCGLITGFSGCPAFFLAPSSWPAFSAWRKHDCRPRGHLTVAWGPLVPRANIWGKGAIGPFLDQSLKTRRWSPTVRTRGLYSAWWLVSPLQR